jgi:hypothetical protein
VFPAPSAGRQPAADAAPPPPGFPAPSAGRQPAADAAAPPLPPPSPPANPAWSRPGPAGLPRSFWQLALTVGVLSCGVASFPLLAFHAERTGAIAPAAIPIAFAAAMAVDGLAGPLAGAVYDSRGPRVLLAVPVAAAASLIAFSAAPALVWAGVAIWGAVNGVLDSTVKAVVADLVPAARRAVAFGWLSLTRGAGLLIAGGALGAAYDAGPSRAVALALAANVAAACLARLLRPAGQRRAAPGRRA